VFVLWLCNQYYYTHDVIWIKITCRDLPYYEDIRTNTYHEYKLHKTKHKNHSNALHTFTKWSKTSSRFVISSRSKLWLICHSMVSTAIYSSCDCSAIKHGRRSLDSRSVKKTSRCFSLLHTK